MTTSLHDHMHASYELIQLDPSAEDVRDPDHGTQFALINYFDAGYNEMADAIAHHDSVCKAPIQSCDDYFKAAMAILVGQFAGLFDALDDDQAVNLVEAFETYLESDVSDTLMKRIASKLFDPATVAMLEQGLAGDKAALADVAKVTGERLVERHPELADMVAAGQARADAAAAKYKEVQGEGREPSSPDQ